MPSEPRVSVIIPVYNGRRYLSQALASVWAQTLGALEVIVVDDGSSDGSAEWLRSLPEARLRVATQPHLGAGPARNRGVLLARAPYLAFLDADDLWPPDKLATQVAALDALPEDTLLFGHYEEFADGPHASTSAAAPGYSSGTLLVRRTAFLRVGLFSSAWRVGEFIDWYARALDLGLAPVMRPEVVLRRRVHAANSTGQAAARRDYAAVLAAVLRRRRVAAGRAHP